MDECSENFFMDANEDDSIDDEDIECGEVTLLKNIWMLNFKCNICCSTFKNYKRFVKHTINHAFDISDDLMDNLIETSLMDLLDDEEALEDEIDLDDDDEVEVEAEHVVEEEDNNDFVVVSKDLKFDLEFLVNNDQDNSSDKEFQWNSSQQDFQSEIEHFLENDAMPDEIFQKDENIRLEQNLETKFAEPFDTDLNEVDLEDQIPENSVIDFKIEICNTNNSTSEDTVDEIQTNISSLKKKDINNDSILCKLCNKTFSSRYNLGRHMQLHQDKKPFKCDLCDAAFKDYGNLSVHRNRHLKIQPHPCTVCNRRFTTTTDLKAHMRRHSDNRPYICDICGITYKAKQELFRHIDRQHANKRPFSCDHCGKRFYDKRTLSEHIVSHSGIRPFKCDTCEKTFSRKKSLAEHKKLHSDVYKHACDYCDKKFQQRPGLVSHIRNFHKI